MNHDQALAAWVSFTDKEIDIEHLSEFFGTIHSWEDVTAKILLESDFLIKYPDVEKVLKGHIPNINKCLLDVDSKYLKKANKARLDECMRLLHCLQVEFCKKSAELVELERQILDAKKILTEERSVI